ncbi:hypothetical protein KPL74_06735 [Bacillus sp. NP157]|nr:hypothetical protein KPL74_06735 [Bacillus sp. NP157]
MARSTPRKRTHVFPARRIYLRNGKGQPVSRFFITPLAAAPGTRAVLDGVIEFDETKFALKATGTPNEAEPDHILLKSEQGKDIEVKVPMGDELNKGEEVTLILNGIELETKIVPEETDFSPLPFTIPGNTPLLEGTNFLNYRLYYSKGSGGTDTGPGDRFVIDKVAPGGSHFLGAPDVDAAIRDGGLTKDKLVTLPDGVTKGLALTIPSYEGFAYGDKVVAIVDGSADSYVTEFPYGHTGDQVAYATQAVIAAAGDGLIGFQYRITDRAGNVSSNSNTLTVQVVLEGAPNLKAVEVPAFDDDDDTGGKQKLIDLADATANDGVVVIIPWSVDFKPGDVLTLFWGEAMLTPYTITASDADAEDDIVIGVMYPAIYEEWTATANDADQIVPVDVLYRLKRGSVDVDTSPSKTVDVNVYQIGGGDPDPETPGNDNLQKPTLVAASNARDKIEGDDFGKPATVEVPKQTRHATPRDVFKLDDVVTVTYQDEALPPHTIVAGDLTDLTEPLVFSIPAKVIEDAGSGTMALQYAITRAVQGGENTTMSPVKDVVVHGKDELPGDGQELAAALCPESEDTWMDMSKINDGTLLALPEWTRFNGTGQEVLIEFMYFSARDGSPIPARGFQQRLASPLTLLDAESQPVKEPDGNERQPVEVPYVAYRIPRERLVYQLPDNRFFYIEAVYKVNNTSGETTPVASAPVQIKIDTRGS